MWGIDNVFIGIRSFYERQRKKRDIKNPREEKSNKVFKKEGEDNA